MSEPEKPMPAVTTPELATFTRQLGAMLGADVNVLRALRIASRHVGNDRLIAAANDLADRLSDGQELHHGLSQHPDLFDAFYVEMTRQGEADGTLGPALLAVADYLDQCPLPSPDEAAGDPGISPAAAPTFPRRAQPLSLLTLGTGMLGLAVAAGGTAAGTWSAAWAVTFGFGWLSALFIAAGCYTWSHHQPDSRSAPPGRPTPPRKTRERKQAEADGVVRNALLEQQEVEEGIYGTNPMHGDFASWPHAKEDENSLR